MNTTATDPLVGKTVSQYEILAKIGGGGMGVVYQARDSKLGRVVALKFLPPQFSRDEDAKQRFVREAQAASATNHPNICTIHNIEQTNDGQLFIVMAHYEGETLKQRLERGPLPVDEALAIARAVAEGLAKAHAQGVVHRDIKPGNLMLTEEGVRILDFGLATLARAQEQLTMAGSTVGTIAYMSPEQARSEDADARSDIWALGVVLYEMLTGQLPFRGPYPDATLYAIKNEPPPPLRAAGRDIPESVEMLTLGALEKDPDRRFQSARDMVHALSVVQGRSIPLWLAKNPDDRYASTRDQLLDLQSMAAASALDRPRWRFRFVRNASPQSARRWAAVVLVAAAVVAGALLIGRPSRLMPVTRDASMPGQKNIVVLPFETVGERGVHYRAFADGLAEAVTQQLTLLTTSRSLLVAPAGEVKRRAVRTAMDARRLLGANLVLTGRLEERGDSLRLIWALKETATGRQLQQKTVSVAAADPLAMETRITESVLDTLNLEFTPAEREALAGRDTTVPAAKELYLQARGYLQDFDRPENVERAISLFTDALNSDGQYAAAYAGLGEAYGYKLIGNVKNAQWIDAGQQACQQAIRLDPRLASAHACLATFANQTGRYEAAVREFEQALQIEPTRDEFYRELARAQEKLGKADDAEKTLRRAIAIRPHYWANYNLLGTFYFNAGRYAEAVEMFTRVVSLAPDTYFGHANLGGALLQMGRYAEAITVLERAVQISPTANAYSNLATALFNRRRFLEAAQNFEEATQVDEKNYAVWGNLGDAYHWAPGQRPRAAEAYGRAIALGRERLKMNARDATLLARLAGYLAMLGERGPALDYLQQALAITPRDGAVQFKAAIVHNQFKETDETLQALKRAVENGYSVTIIRDAPNFDPLWAQARFQNLLRSR